MLCLDLSSAVCGVRTCFISFGGLCPRSCLPVCCGPTCFRVRNYIGFWFFSLTHRVYLGSRYYIQRGSIGKALWTSKRNWAGRSICFPPSPTRTGTCTCGYGRDSSRRSHPRIESPILHSPVLLLHDGGYQLCYSRGAGRNF